jgi:endonuclease/exonuclease/phosphatase family metal-dependent hydrolase
VTLRPCAPTRIRNSSVMARRLARLRLPSRGVPRLSVASFNAHAGVDGWGRPYDLTDACRRLDADVVVLQETFAPLDGPSQADDVATALDYATVELPLARAWRRKEPIWHGKGWEPRRVMSSHLKALRVGGRVGTISGNLAGYEEGTWGLAVLSRARVVATEELELGRLKRDFTHRSALVVRLATESVGADLRAERSGTQVEDDGAVIRADDTNFTVIGMHAAHLSDGSPLQLRRLHKQLPSRQAPAALLGDLNLWGPPVSVMLPGWRRAVRGRTWPAWRPHSQPDHILVTRLVTVVEADVLRTGDSDHRAVRAVLSW